MEMRPHLPPRHIALYRLKAFASCIPWKVVLLLILLGGLSGIYHFDSLLFQLPERAEQRLSQRIARHLEQNHDIFLLLTFDQPVPMENVSRSPVNHAGTIRVPSPIGWAQQFDGYHRTSIDTMREWMDVGNRFSISTWVKLDSASPHQDIIFSRAHRGRVGLRLADGEMTFHVPAWDQQISYPFERYGEFTHLLAVADGESGQAYLYENGILMASGHIETVAPPNHNIELGKTRWYVARYPLIGQIGETVIWNRALSAEDALQLATARRSVLHRYSLPRHRWMQQANRYYRQFIHQTLKILDAFTLFQHSGRVFHVDLPDLHIHISNSQLRSLLQQHHDSQQSGRRVVTGGALTARYSLNGQHGYIQIRLHGSPSRYPDGDRIALEIECHPNSPELFGTDRLRLSPPESADYLKPLFETALANKAHAPHISTELCRLTINGIFLGVYYVEDYRTMGIAAGSQTDLFNGPRSPFDWHSRFHEHRATGSGRIPFEQPYPFSHATLTTIYDHVVDQYADLLLNDMASPHSSRYIRYRMRQLRNDLKEWAAPEVPEHPLKRVTSDMLLGQNPSSGFIIDDLDLLTCPDNSWEWHSSDERIISHTGKVNRPSGTLPHDIHLTARLSTTGETLDRQWTFRVMPQHTLLPAIMLYANEQLNKIVRRDAVIHYYPAGTDVSIPRTFTALQDTRGGISHRGGTSYWEPKKPFSLRFDSAHYLLDDTSTRHLYFSSGYFDATFMRNKLSYDLFRSFSQPDSPRHAPVTRWAEVFVNGTYHGLYEINTRVQRRMLGFPAYRPDLASHAELFKIIHAERGLQEADPYSVIQKLPQRRWGYHAEPYFELLRFLQEADGHDRDEAVAARFDMENAIDFHLFVNATEGRDNIDMNFYIARGPAPSDRYFFVVYDCDKNFLDGSDQVFENRFIRHLRTDDFRGQLATRWQELRMGPAQTGTLLAHIEDMEMTLRDYVHWEYERWGYNNDQSFEQLVDHLRYAVKQRLHLVDARLLSEQTNN